MRRQAGLTAAQGVPRHDGVGRADRDPVDDEGALAVHAVGIRGLVGRVQALSEESGVRAGQVRVPSAARATTVRTNRSAKRYEARTPSTIVRLRVTIYHYRCHFLFLVYLNTQKLYF